MPRIDVGSNMINWACDRARTTPEDLVGKLPKILEWITGEVRPTLKQLKKFAKAVHVPVGYLFLSTPQQSRCQYLTFAQSKDRKCNVRALIGLI